MEVDGLNGNGLKERCLFTAETLWLSDVSTFRRQFRASPLFFFFFSRRDDQRGESDLVRRRWGECQKKASMQVQRGHGPEGKGEKRKQTATQTIKMKIRKLSKFHSGTNVTAQSRVAEEPLTTGTWLFVCEWRPRMDVMSLEKGSAGCHHAVNRSTGHCWSWPGGGGRGGEEEGGAEASCARVHHIMMRTTCHCFGPTCVCVCFFVFCVFCVFFLGPCTSALVDKLKRMIFFFKKSTQLAVWLRISTPNGRTRFAHVSSTLQNISPFFPSPVEAWCASIAHFLTGLFQIMTKGRGLKKKSEKEKKK